MKKLLIALLCLGFWQTVYPISNASVAVGHSLYVRTTGGTHYESIDLGSNNVRLWFKPKHAIIGIYWTSDWKGIVSNLRGIGCIFKELEQHSDPWLCNYIDIDLINIQEIRVIDRYVCFNSGGNYDRKHLLAKTGLPADYGLPQIPEPPIIIDPMPKPVVKTEIFMASKDFNYIRMEAEAKTHIDHDRLVILFDHEDDFKSAQKELDIYHVTYKASDRGKYYAVAVKFEDIQFVVVDGNLIYQAPIDEPAVEEPVAFTATRDSMIFFRGFMPNDPRTRFG